MTQWFSPQERLRRRAFERRQRLAYEWRDRPATGGVAESRRVADRRVAGGLPRLRSGNAPTRVALGAVAGSPPLAVRTLSRLAYGPRAGDVAAFEALGATDDSRHLAWVDQQLDPASIDDSAAESRIAAAGYTTLDKTVAQLWADHFHDPGDWEIHMQPLWEVEALAFLRAVHSKRQLLEVLVEFWHDHFSCYGQQWAIAPVWVDHDRRIRQHALGNFREMLEATASSTAMLWYLDNYVNQVDGPNENYAREVFELHTLGVDAYFGVSPPASVPLDGNGLPLGWVDADIQEAARCLTGWTYHMPYYGPPFLDTGEFYYHDPWHDDGAKHVLGVDLPSGQPSLEDGRDLFDLLAAHPATGRHVAKKLCRRLIGDFPQPSIVDAAAQVFTANWQEADQLEQVVRTIVLSSEFKDTWGAKVRRPFEIFVAALRASGADLSFALSSSEWGSISWLYPQTGHERFGWEPPSGYPDVAAAWISTTPRVLTWRLTNWLVDYDWSNDRWRVDLAAQVPAGVRSAEAIVDHWIDRVFARPIAAEHRSELIDFMAQGFLPTLDLPLDTDDSVRSRVQSLVGLMFMIPEFLER